MGLPLWAWVAGGCCSGVWWGWMAGQLWQIGRKKWAYLYLVSGCCLMPLLIYGYHANAAPEKRVPAQIILELQREGSPSQPLENAEKSHET